VKSGKREREREKKHRLANGTIGSIPSHIAGTESVLLVAFAIHTIAS